MWEAMTKIKPKKLILSGYFHNLNTMALSKRRIKHL